MESNYAKIVQKEELNSYKYSNEDVLSHDKDKMNLRAIYLKKAEVLGNNYKSKVKISFVDSEHQIFSVETTVWATHNDFISLKGGVNIPIRAIIDIEF